MKREKEWALFFTIEGLHIQITWSVCEPFYTKAFQFIPRAKITSKEVSIYSLFLFLSLFIFLVLFQRKIDVLTSYKIAFRIYPEMEEKLNNTFASYTFSLTPLICHRTWTAIFLVSLTMKTTGIAFLFVNNNIKVNIKIPKKSLFVRYKCF